VYYKQFKLDEKQKSGSKTFSFSQQILQEYFWLKKKILLIVSLIELHPEPRN
jgi:hypothetical protein